jgi:hypothetical protein
MMVMVMVMVMMVTIVSPAIAVALPAQNDNPMMTTTMLMTEVQQDEVANPEFAFVKGIYLGDEDSILSLSLSLSIYLSIYLSISSSSSSSCDDDDGADTIFDLNVRFERRLIDGIL